MDLPAFGRHAQRYLGDTKKKIVHDLMNESKECDIHGTLASGKARRWVPDKLAQVSKDGYEPCPHCFSKKK